MNDTRGIVFHCVAHAAITRTPWLLIGFVVGWTWAIVAYLFFAMFCAVIDYYQCKQFDKLTEGIKLKR